MIHHYHLVCHRPVHTSVFSFENAHFLVRFRLPSTLHRKRCPNGALSGCMENVERGVRKMRSRWKIGSVENADFLILLTVSLNVTICRECRKKKHVHVNYKNSAFSPLLIFHSPHFPHSTISTLVFHTT